MNKRKKIIEKLKRYKENEIKKKKEEEKNKLVISSGINDFEVLTDNKNLDNESPKDNKIFISPQNEINILMEPQKKLLLSQNYQSFSLIASDSIKFKFSEPAKNSPKLNNNFLIQLDNVENIIKNIEKEKEEKDLINKKKCKDDALNKLMEILEKAQNESDKEIKRQVLDKLNRNINMGKLAKILDDYFKKRAEKDKNIEVRESFHFLKKYENENTFKQILLISKQYDEEIKDEKEKENEKSEDNSDENNLKVIQKKNILFTIKKEEQKEPDAQQSSPKKRIAHRRSPLKSYSKNKNLNKKRLKKALDKWRSNSMLMNKDIYDKYQRKVLQDLIKVYQKGKDNLIKKYFDKWKNVENEEDNNDNNEILKYKKKPKMEFKSDIIEEYEQETIKDNDTFKPIYVLPKENLHKKIFDNPNIDESVHESMDSNNIMGKVIPYVKKYGQRNENNKDNSNYDNEKEMNGLNEYNNIQNNKDNYKNGHSSDNSSEESYLSGITLIQNRKEIKLPRNYISQSYFIDKPLQNPISNGNNNTKMDIYKINQIPNMMKGDFGNFLENNPKIFRKKNPRIQVTRSTCDLSNEINNNPNINNDIIINNNKVLSRIVKKCDYDLYANQKSKSKRDKWYSMSIPLNQINQVKQIPDYKTNNKNEMIEKNENDKMYYNYKPIKSYANIHRENNRRRENNDYTLQEMNCSQFYRSPMRSIKKNKYGENFGLNNTVIKIPGKQRRNIHQSLSPLDNNRRRYYDSKFE